MTVSESAKQYTIAKEYDVLVAGGGIAGIAAALAAARNGAKTLLIEKMFLLGGLATSGLITVYLPICDGNGRQVSYGIAEELLRLSVKHGHESSCGQWEERDAKPWLEGGTIEEKKAKRFQTQFNANLYAILCEQLLLENGVEILYGTSICAAVVEGKKIKAVLTENKTGRQAFAAKSFIDATGDADLCHLAGAKTVVFQQGNILASWYYEHQGDAYRLKVLGFSDIPDKYKEDGAPQEKRYTGLTGHELSQMVCDSHANILQDFLKDGGITPGHAIGTIATIPQVRMTRRIDGNYAMCDEEQFTYFEDSIGMIPDWRDPGPVYEIPFRCLYGNEIVNLITCGRCISVTEDMWDISRAIPGCSVTGEAAGTAAAMGDDFSTLSTVALQDRLRRNGVLLHTDELI